MALVTVDFSRPCREYLRASLNEYKEIVRICALPSMQFKGNEHNFSQELKMCQELVALLPAKIERLHLLDAGRSGTA